MHVGGHHDACGDIMITVWGVKYHGQKNLHYHHYNRPLGQCMEHHTCMLPTTWTVTITTANPLALRGASYRTHLKGVFCSFLSIVTAAYSRVSYETHLYKCFQAAFTLSSLQQTLQVSCEAQYETHLGKCLGVASTPSSLDQTPRVSWGCIWDPPKKFFSGSSCTILAPVSPRPSFGSPLWSM